MNLCNLFNQSARSYKIRGAVLRFDFHFYPRWQIELAQRVYSAGRRGVDVQQPLVGGQLELLAALLVHVGRTQYGKNLLTGRQRNRSCDYSACATDSFYDLFS